MDPVAQKIKAITATDRDEFAERFAQGFLEQNKFVRGDPGAREIQPLFGWLLMEDHATATGKKIEVAPGVKAVATPGPLLIALGGAVFDLHTQLKSPSNLAVAIQTHADVQQLAQETTMRIVTGAQIMANFAVWAQTGDTSSPYIYYLSGFYPSVESDIHPKLESLGFTSAEYKSSRATLVLKQAALALFNQKEPYVLLNEVYKKYVERFSTIASVQPSEAGQKITDSVSGADDDYVTVEVQW